MAIHICRDYLTQNITTVNRSYIASYLLAIFMRRVLGYSYVGDTNYPINDPGISGSLLIATGDSTPTAASPTFSAGKKAGINLGSQKEFWVSIPASARVVSTADIGRILVLKSSAYPRHNSGIFNILGVNTADNAYIIDYRSLNDFPPVEASDTIQWYLYDKDINCPIYGNANTKSTSEYRSDGNSATPRIILQSPHATAWQARICNESLNDWNGVTTTIAVASNGASLPQATINAVNTSLFSSSGIINIVTSSGTQIVTYTGKTGSAFTGCTGGIGTMSTGGSISGGGALGSVGAGYCVQTTVAPGFGGNSAGDYAAGGSHFHAPMWYNVSSTSDTIYSGGAPGFGDNSATTTIQYRITIVGDDTGQGVTMFCRRPGNAITPRANITTFGLAENEPSPLPVLNQARLFILGSGRTFSDHTNDGSLLIGDIGTNNFSQGMSAAPFGTPIICASSFWAYINLGAQGTSPIFDLSASDCPFTSATELLPIDLMIGTLPSWTSNATQAFPYSPKTIGTIPHLRAGRSNFGDFSPTTDPDRSYQHLRRGLYIPWGGPQFIP